MMVGDAMALRHQMNTLLVEVGWPRLPEHGFVAHQGLARARISLSPNPTIDANLIDELMLKQHGEREVTWAVLTSNQPGETVTETKLRAYLHLLLSA